MLYLNSVAVTLDGEVKEGENMQLLFAWCFFHIETVCPITRNCACHVLPVMIFLVIHLRAFCVFFCGRKHVWGSFCLCYEDAKLIEDAAHLQSLGIKNNEQVLVSVFKGNVVSRQNDWSKAVHILSNSDSDAFSACQDQDIPGSSFWNSSTQRLWVLEIHSNKDTCETWWT